MIGQEKGYGEHLPRLIGFRVPTHLVMEIHFVSLA